MQEPQLNKTAQILELIAPFIKEGKILARTYAQINNSINEFIFLESDNKIIACAGLKSYKNDKAGEIYILAVDKNHQNQGLSEQLLEKISTKAKLAQMNYIFALTKYNTKWFLNNNFKQINVEQLPISRQKNFDYQRNSTIFSKIIV